MRNIVLFMAVCLIVASCTEKIVKKEKQKKDFEHFISTEGAILKDGDDDFRFISMNIPNLNYIEDEMVFTLEHAYRYPNEFEIRDAIKTIKQMGGKVVRIYTLPVKRSDEPECVPTFITGPGEFVEEAFVVNDLMLKIANEEGIRIIFSLLNNWKWMGGAPQYAEFRGKTFDDFWTDPQLIDDFKKTIEFTINRTNTLTGEKYSEDKAIMCWETGNELVCPYAWTKEIAAYIKSLDKNHLLMDGYFAMDNHRYVYQESVDDPNIDILSSHHYEQNAFQQMDNINANRAIINGKKPYVLGELGFESTTAHERIYDFIIENKDISGALNWSIRSHRREGGFYWHSEPVGHNLYKAYHWPGFANGHLYDEEGLLRLMQRKAYEINGLDVPLSVPEAPNLLPIEKAYAISWQGSVGASGYNIDRSESSTGPWEQVAYNVSDAAIQYFPLFNDVSVKIGKQYYYRIEAINESGVSPQSNVVGPVLVKEKAIVDEMECIMKVFMARNVSIDKGLDRKFKEDTERILADKDSELYYFVPGKFQEAKFYSFEQSQQPNLILSTSIDGIKYTEVIPEVWGNRTGTGDYDYWDGILYTLKNVPANSQFLKMEFKDKTQLGRVEIVYN